MNITCALPSASSTVAPIASAYFWPSWNTWPTSMPRAIDSVPWPSGEAIAGEHVADVGDQLGLGQVATPVDAGQVEALFVGADHEVGHRRDAAVGDDADLLQSD